MRPATAIPGLAECSSSAVVRPGSPTLVQLGRPAGRGGSRWGRRCPAPRRAASFSRRWAISLLDPGGASAHGPSRTCIGGLQTGLQARLDELVEVAVQHRLGVAGLDPVRRSLMRTGRARRSGSGCPSRCRPWCPPAPGPARGASASPARRAWRAAASWPSRFLCWERSDWHCTTMPVGHVGDAHRRVGRLTCWPPAPDWRGRRRCAGRTG